MNRMLVLTAFAAFALSRCGCANDINVSCISNSECSAGQQCVSGVCTATGTGGNGGNGGSGGNGGGGSTVVTGCNPNAPDNATRDTDCDGLSDADEYTRDHGGGQKTDPCNSDTDGDGIPDGVEVGSTMSVSATCTAFVGDKDPGSRTNPTVADSDGDGLPDGQEDKNHDGRVDPGESNPTRIDSDCDGIADGDEVSGKFGCATDPSKRDTDDDGIPDGVEQNITPPGADEATCMYGASVFDADPSTKTNACNSDTDGDGIGDGTEDGNKNGRPDMGELNPNDPADGMGPAGAACAIANLKPVLFQSSGFADVNIALAPTFTEVGRLVDGTEKGLVFYDATTKVAGLAISVTPTGAGVSNDEIAGRARIGSTGTISAPLTQTFTTWDTFPAVRATYELGGNEDIKTRINDIAKAFLSQTTTGILAGAAGVTGPFKVQVEYVRRTPMRAIVVIAIAPSTGFGDQQLFTTDDTAGGSAVAQFSDYTSSTCELFDSKAGGKVDFVWVVDDSGSMGTSQNAVGSVGDVFSRRLVGAGLDWRVGGVTSSKTRPFTAAPGDQAAANEMKRWFTQNDALWFNVNGSASETFFPPAQSFVGGNPVRPDAALHYIVLTDTREQSSVQPATMTAFIQNNYNTGGRTSMMHGIICPEGQQCGDGETTETPGKIHQVIRATGGVIGDITVANTAGAAAQAQLEGYINAILNAAIGGAGYPLNQAPISSTIKVAIETGGTRGTCATADVPRSRTDGFDYDSVARRIVFFGNCLPSSAGKKIAVSYRYWIENSPDPGGDPCGAMCIAPMMCDPTVKSCVCAPNCGNSCTGATPNCNQSSCTCSGDIN